MKLFLASVCILPCVGAQAAGPAYLDRPADDPAVPARQLLVGNDFRRLLDTAIKAPTKGEFETGEQFQQRSAAWAEKPVYGSVLMTSLLALPIGAATSIEDGAVAWYSYNADTQQLSICAATFGYEQSPADPVANGRVIVLEKKFTDKSSYVGRNAFGVSKVIYKAKLWQSDVFVPDAHYRDNCRSRIDLDVATAKAQLPGARFVLLGKVEAPWAATQMRTIEPTINEPIDRSDTIKRLNFRPAEILMISRSGSIFARTAFPY